MDNYTRHNFIFRLLKKPVKLITRRFGYTCDDLSGIEEPYLLLSNHNTDLDPVFVGSAAGKMLYFVATENITRIPVIGKLLIRWFDPIIHLKGKAGIKTVINIISRIKAGHSVCMFAEGNRSFSGTTMPIPSVTAKLAKKTGVPLVTFRMHGGYFTSPRWSVKMRRGKIHGELVHVYSAEELAGMKENEVFEAITKDLFVDAYEDQKKEPVRFRGKKLAEGIESTLFMCPSCKKFSTLFGKGSSVKCSCGFSCVYDEYGCISEPSGHTYTISELDRLQKKELLTRIRTEDGILFSDNVTFCTIDDTAHKVTEKIPGRLSADRDSLQLGNLVVPFGKITGLAVSTRNTLLLHYKDKEEKHIDIKGPVSFSALKYYYLYQASGEGKEI